MDEVVDCPHCGAESYRDEMAVQGGRCPVCGKYNEELDMGQKFGSQASLRIAAAQFIDNQGGVTDPGELAFRADRHVANLTWSWPRTASAAARDLFVAAVLASCDCGQDQDCEDCGAEAGESCRPWCTGQAAHEDEKAEKKKKKSHRVASDDDTARRVKECESGSCGHPEPTEDGDDAWAEAHDNPHVPRKKSHRTAFLPDFDDQLLFGN